MSLRNPIADQDQTDQAQPGAHGERQPWWKSAVVYQVYPRSFADSNGDGVGDIQGVIEHLDHIADLGIDVIWLSPVYDSPHDDNGYDIRNYNAIDSVFGTLDDMDSLIAQVHERGMRIMMDLVVNHTSDEHAWFLESRQSKSSATSDWYIWRDPKPGTRGGDPGAEPNNWGSFFSGSAWQYVPERDQYYLHLFSRKQPDLNWESPQVRREIYQMMGWWLDRGVDGFRMDVINFISKDQSFPDGPVLPTGFGDGGRFFQYGPRVHEYLAEMRREVFASRPQTYLTVGEMPGVTVEQARRFTHQHSGQLNMVFQFEHMDLDQQGSSKWSLRDVSVQDLKRSLGRWQLGVGPDGWNSLYWSNHDQPRVVSRFGDPHGYWFASATALATCLYLQRGTPYIYQGEELGMTNVQFTEIESFRDIETLNYYRDAVLRRGEEPRLVLAALRRKSRDNARAPMQWTDERHAGFTSGEPWMPVNDNYHRVNARRQRDDPASVYSFYRKLIRLRHQESVLTDGEFTMLLEDHPSVYAYVRYTPTEAVTVIANLGRATLDVVHGDGTTLLTNYPPNSNAVGVLRPWEVRVLRGHQDPVVQDPTSLALKPR